jgi:hypothetical protein
MYLTGEDLGFDGSLGKVENVRRLVEYWAEQYLDTGKACILMIVGDEQLHESLWKLKSSDERRFVFSFSCFDMKCIGDIKNVVMCRNLSPRHRYDSLRCCSDVAATFSMSPMHFMSNSSIGKFIF